jgi:hypothetical protein
VVLSIEPQTWIVGRADDSGLATECLLALEHRFALPATVAIDRGERRQGSAPAGPLRVLAFVPRTHEASERCVDLLRGEEAAAALVRATGTASLPTTRAAADVVAVTVDRARSGTAIEEAVKLAVTTLIDWGHEICCRPRPAAAAPNR